MYFFLSENARLSFRMQGRNFKLVDHTRVHNAQGVSSVEGWVKVSMGVIMKTQYHFREIKTKLLTLDLLLAKPS